VPPLEEHLDVVLEGVRLFPRDTALVMRATLLAAKRGFPQRANELARLGMKVATDSGEKDKFRLIASAYERDSTSPAPDTAQPAAAPESTLPYLLKVP
jgi:hypothetical protein